MTNLDQELEPIRQRAQQGKISDGPWYLLEVMDHSFVAAKPTKDHPYYGRTRNIDIGGDEDYPRKVADLEFIANSRTDVPRLLEIIDELVCKSRGIL